MNKWHSKKTDGKFKNINNNMSHNDKKIREELGKKEIKGLIKKAKELAQNLSPTKASQVRRMYNSVLKTQEQLSENKNEKWERELSMLKPRITYQSKRHKDLQDLTNYIISFISIIEEQKNKEKKETFTEKFCLFMEAVVAYHK